MVIEQIGEALYTSAGLFWKAFWALALGYAFSSIIQVFISRSATAKHLGKGGPKELGKASILGFISSSCSFAALSATRGLYTKGASLTSALAYMFASTNLAIEVAILAYIFLGWQYAVALFVGAPILIAIQSFIVRLTYPKSMAEKALEHAKEESGAGQDPSEGLPKSLHKKAVKKETWKKVASTYKGEWKMVYKEIFIGFLVAGFVSTLVPQSFFEFIFPTDINPWIALPIQALMAPILAIITVIGSMGNGPLAAVLASNGVMFGAIMAFLYSDFNVPPALKINANYYGWPFASYLALVTAASAVLSGIIIHGLFASLNILPTSVKMIDELARFSIDYTFWLNMVSLIVAAVFFYIARNAGSGHHDHH